MQLADSHCHIQDERLADSAEDVLTRARAAGVRLFICCGTAPRDWQAVAQLAAGAADVVPAYGLHPWHVGERSDTWKDDLRSRLLSDPRAAVGEIGLDHAIRQRNDDGQMTTFAEQLRIAVELRRPACIHCRKAWGALLPALEETRPPSGFVIHSYSGPAELVAPLTELGAHFSFSATVTWSRNRRAHGAAASVPTDRLLIETDAPDLPPAPENGAPPVEINEPANLVRVLRAVAAIRGVTEQDLAETTWNNTIRLFGIRG